MALLDDLLPYQASPESQLSLITSVLGASAGWLLHSLIAKAFSPSAKDTGGACRLIFVSFIHNKSHLLDCVRKLGVDLTKSIENGSVVFVDGFSSLFMDRGTNLSQEHVYLNFARGGLQKLVKDVGEQIGRVKSPDGRSGACTMLVLENPDLLIPGAGVLSAELMDAVLEWHTMADSTVVSVNADSAFTARGRTRLEMEQSSFVLTLAHQATNITSLRMLDTGIARDVSGVLRVTVDQTNSSNRKFLKRLYDKESLYMIKDRAIEVFDRNQHR